MSVTIPEFSTSAVITGQTLIAEADEQLNILMDDVKEYVEDSYNEVATQVIADTSANALIASQAADSASDSADDAASSALAASQYASDLDINNVYAFTTNRVVPIANSLAPYSGYMAWQKDNFYFNTSSSFLASIADKNRYLKFGDKVVDTYGEELITNGDFSNGTIGWTLETGWSVSSGKLTHDGLTQYTKARVSDNNLEIGKQYRIKFTVKKNSGELYLALGFSTKLLSEGDNDIIRTAIGTQFTFQSNYFNGTIDNISVREIQTKSAIDYIPEVYVQDQAANGLTTQQSVNAGDYVVVDRTYAVETETIGLSYQGRIASSYAPSGYLVKWGSTTTASNTDITSFGSAAGTTLKWVKSGGYYFPCTYLYKSTSTDYQFYCDEGIFESYKGVDAVPPSTTSSGTNITVLYQLDEVYRAKTDAPSGTELTNTTYFEVRDDKPISNQIAFLHTMDSNTKVYEGITNEILFNDALAIETPKAIMLKNGFSEVSKGLYSKGSKWYIFSGYWQTLNKGAYHPVWNMAGTKYFRRADLSNFTITPWYSSLAPTVLSVANTFTLTTYVSSIAGNGTSLSGRPDSKYYDIIYPDQFISFESSELAYKPTELEMKEIREYEKFRGVEGLVFTTGYIANVSTAIDSSTYPDYKAFQDYFNNNGLNYITDLDLEYVVTDSNGNTYKPQKNVIPNTNNIFGRNIWFPNTFTGAITTMITKSIPFNSKGTSLTTFAYGDPQFYPQIMKDRLSEGKGLFGIEPQLVSIV